MEDHSAHMGHMDHMNSGMDHGMDHGAAHGSHDMQNHSGHNGHNQGGCGDGGCGIENGSGHGGCHGGMSMAFHFGVKELILFDQWSIDSAGGLIASVLVIVVMAACYEGLKYYREYLFWKTYNSLQYRAVTLPEKTAVVGASNEDSTAVNMVGEVMHRHPPKMTSFMHIYQTFLHIVQVTLSFLLMLVFMTYNVWLCMGVVIGAAIGYFLFGWKKSVIVDITEHCH